MDYKVINQLKERNFDRGYSKSEASVLDYLDDHFKQIPFIGVVKIAAESYTSQATVNRACKLLGFKGYSQLKYAAEEDIKLMERKSSSHIVNIEYIISKIKFETSVDFVQKLVSSRDKLLVFGLGGSHISAQYLQRQLLYFGISSVFVAETQMLKHFSGYTLLLLSSSGETQRCLQVISEARKAHIDVLSITKKDSSVMSESKLSFCHDVPVDKMEGHSREQQLHMIIMIHEIIDQLKNTIPGKFNK